MARKGILPRRKRGRSTIHQISSNGSTIPGSYQNDTRLSPFDFSQANVTSSRSSSPITNFTQLHLANYKVPEGRQDL